MQELTTPRQFRNFVLDVLQAHEQTYRRSLEEYLRSLWVLIAQYQNQPVSHTLIGRMIAEAFATEPAPFDQAWLNYEQPLNFSYRDGRYVLEELDGYEVNIIEDYVDELRILKHTILFQIADLHRLKGNQLVDPHRYFGVRSPTGNDWYNFEARDYLERGTGIAIANRGDDDVPFEGCDWVALAGILELGRLYE
jgi:hypothetical protein